jgi:O-antigen/teichoic acid export membrane protein
MTKVFKHVLRGKIPAITFRVASISLTVAANLLLARLMGRNGFGEYSYWMSVVGVLSVLLTFGLTTQLMTAASRAAIDGISELAIVTKSSVVQLFLISVFVLPGFIVLQSQIVTSNGALNPFYFIVLALLIAVSSLVDTLYRGFYDPVRGQISEFIARPLMLILIASISYSLNGLFDPIQAFYSYAISVVVTLLLTLVVLKEILTKLLREWKSREVKVCISKGSLTFGCIVIVEQLVGFVPLFIFMYYDESGQAADYKIAILMYTLSTASLRMLSIVDLRSFSINKFQEEGVKSDLELRVSAIVSFVFSFLILIAYVCFADWILTPLLGAEYSSSYSATKAMLVGACFVSAFGTINARFIAEDRQNVLLMAQILNLLVVVACGVPSIYLFGSLGGAIAIIGGACISKFILLFSYSAR